MLVRDKWILANIGKSIQMKSLTSNCSKGLVIVKNDLLLKLIVIYIVFFYI